MSVVAPSGAPPPPPGGPGKLPDKPPSKPVFDKRRFTKKPGVGFDCPVRGCDRNCLSVNHLYRHLFSDHNYTLAQYQRIVWGDLHLRWGLQGKQIAPSDRKWLPRTPPWDGIPLGDDDDLYLGKQVFDWEEEQAGNVNDPPRASSPSPRRPREEDYASSRPRNPPRTVSYFPLPNPPHEYYPPPDPARYDADDILANATATRYFPGTWPPEYEGAFAWGWVRYVWLPHGPRRVLRVWPTPGGREQVPAGWEVRIYNVEDYSDYENEGEGNKGKNGGK